MADQEESDTVTKRLFIGGLSAGVTSKEIEERFSRFGKITGLSLKVRKDDDGNPVKCFAHLNIEGNESHIKKCFDAYQNTKWKGSVLKLQYAKESFVSRLEKEREAREEETSVCDEQREVKGAWKPPVFEEVKGGAVPGTPIPGKKDWVVGKYGRILPVLKVKKSSKTVKHDPSKLCHTVKVFKEDKDTALNEASCNALTWEIDTPDTEITKKRKGQFPDSDRGPKDWKKKLGHQTEETKSKVSQFLKKKNAEYVTLNGGDLEVVSLKSVTPMSQPVVKTNKFDSDIESDSEDIAVKAPNWRPPRSKFDSDIDSDVEDLSAVKLGKQSTPAKSNLSSKLSNNLDQQLKSAQNDKKLNKDQKRISEGKEVLNSTENTSANVKSIENKRRGKEEPPAKIPAFKGLSMLGMSADDESSVKKNFVVSEETQQKNSGLEKNSFSLSTGIDKDSIGDSVLDAKGKKKSVQLEGKKRKRTESTSEANQSLEEESNRNITQPSKKANKKSEHNLSQSTPFVNSMSVSPQKKLTKIAVKENVVDFFDDPRDNGDYESDHSASSADSYEIIARKKRKQGVLNSSDAKTSIGSGALTSRQPITAKKQQKTNSLDQNLSVSEYYSGADEMEQTSISAPASSMSIEPYDSDLDDNDFELVAKKLAKIAGVSLTDPSTKKKKPIVDKLSSNRQASEGPESVQNLQNNTVSGSREKMDKKAAANEKRLQAVKEQMKNKQRQQDLMKKALSSLDSSGSKKIVFSSDDEKSDDEKHKKSMEKSPATDDSGKKEPKSALKLFEDSSDEGESNDEESDYEEMFKSKPHFEGKKGEKLMELERKIGDKRFKLDEKFIESDSEDEEEEQKEAAAAEEGKEDFLKEERAASMKVLENVIGKSKLDQFTAKLKRNTKHIVDMNSVRFDPTKLTPSTTPAKAASDTTKVKMNEVKSKFDEEISEKSAQNEVLPKPKKMEFLESKSSKEKEEKKDKQKSKKEKIKEEKSLKPEKNPDASKPAKKSKVEMDSSLISLFKKDEGDKKDDDQTFSLLSQFGDYSFKEGDTGEATSSKPLSGLFASNALEKKTPDIGGNLDSSVTREKDNGSESSSDESDDDSDGEVIETKKGPATMDYSNLNVSDSSDSEMEVEEEEESANDESEVESVVGSERSASPAEDPKISDRDKELLDAGRLDVRFTKEQWLEKWQDLRSNIVKIYKKKHKEAVKNKKVQSEAKRRKEFLQSSKKSHWFKKKR